MSDKISEAFDAWQESEDYPGLADHLDGFYAGYRAAEAARSDAPGALARKAQGCETPVIEVHVHLDGRGLFSTVQKHVREYNARNGRGRPV